VPPFRVRLFLLPVLLSAFSSALHAADLLTPVSVTSSTSGSDSFSASNLIDNSGLSSAATLANYQSVTHASAANPSRAWATTTSGGSGSDYFAAGGVPPTLTFTLDDSHFVTDLVVWGYFFTSPSNNEAKSFTVEFSSDGGASWPDSVALTHNRSAGNSDNISFGAGYNANTIRLTITDNHFGAPGAVGGRQVGLGEVKFIGGPPLTPTPRIEVSPIVDFGNLPAGSLPGSMTLTVHNLGSSQDLQVSTDPLSSPFQVTGSPLTIPARQSGDLTLHFNAQGVPGCYLETLNLTSNDPAQGLVSVSILGAYDCTLDPPAQPTLLPVEGTFVDPFMMTISTTEANAVLIYTLDGSLPSPSNGIPYPGPIPIDHSIQIRAAVLRGGVVSKPQSKSYLRLTEGLETYTSKIPIAIIDNFGGGIIPNKGWSFDTQTGAGLQQVARQPACLHLIDRDPNTGLASMTGVHDLTERIGIRVRGAFSSTWNSKPYSVETWDEFDNDKNATPLGLPGESDWILYYPHPSYDLPLIANTFSWELSRQTGRYGTRYRLVDVFINEDGGDLTPADRVGVYAFAEKVTRDDDRLEFERLSEDGSTGGWLLSVNRMDPIPVGGFPAPNGALTPQFFHTAGSNGLQETLPNFGGAGDDIPRQYNAYLNFDQPSGYRINSAQRATIEDWFEEFEEVFYNDSLWLHPVNGYRKHLNTRDFIDYFHLHNLAKQGDSMLVSLFPWVSSGERKLHIGPIWDYNLGAYNSDPSSELFYRNDRLWFPRLFEDPGFMREYIDRWFELRRGPFSTNNLSRLVNSQAAEFTIDLAVAQGASATRWSSEILSMKDYLSRRTSWIDQQFFQPPSLSHAGGAVSAQFTLTITNATSTAGTTYFTVDGSDPIDGGGTLYTSPIAFNASAQIRARIQAPNGEWSALNEASYVTGTPAGVGDLVLSEIMYHPFGDPGAEFLELLNINPAESLDLALVRFAAGVEFTFPIGTTLAPGERILVVRDLLSFEAVHGMGHPVAGEFQLGGALDNSGDHLTLLDATGNPLLDFSYGDDPPWPESADGDGDSLVLIGPWSNPDHGLFTSWRSSTTMDGNPGSDDQTALAGDPQGDPDHDQLPALLEHALGTSNLIQDSLADFLTWNPDPATGTELFLVSSLAAQSVQVSIEFSDDLRSWQALAQDPEFDAHLTGGRVRHRWLLPAPQPQGRYFRIRSESL
jgi:hypothetical protein